MRQSALLWTPALLLAGCLMSRLDTNGSTSGGGAGSETSTAGNGGKSSGGQNSGGTNAPVAGETSNGGSSQAAGSENGGTDSGGTDSGGAATGGTDSGGTDSGGTDSGGTDSGGSTSGAGTGGTATGGGGSGGTSPVDPYKPCNTAPAGTVPALKRGPAINGFSGMQTAGQIVGVPGEANILYVIGHRDGAVHIVKDGAAQATPLISVSVASAGNNEQGLLSMALHPSFASNHLFYLFYSASGGGAMTIDEFERPTQTTASFKRNIYSRPRAGTGTFHNGGAITFNPKDASPFLYFSVGNNESNEAGDAAGFAGRVLQITPQSKAIAQFAYGLRNPYRMSIDRLTGDMFIADVANGPGGTIIFQAFGKAGVTDFGYRNNNGNPDVNEGVLRDSAGAAIIGGFVYRGNKIPGLCGRYFYGNHDGGAVKSIVVTNGVKVGSTTTHTSLAVPGNITSFGEDGEGELYMASMSNAIYKIEPQ